MESTEQRSKIYPETKSVCVIVNSPDPLPAAFRQERVRAKSTRVGLELWLEPRALVPISLERHLPDGVTFSQVEIVKSLARDAVRACIHGEILSFSAQRQRKSRV